MRELGKVSHVSYSYIHRLEKGKRFNPSERIVERLLSCLKPNRYERKALYFLMGREILFDVGTKEYLINLL